MAKVAEVVADFTVTEAVPGIWEVQYSGNGGTRKVSETRFNSKRAATEYGKVLKGKVMRYE